jgi:hypothetical protein
MTNFGCQFPTSMSNATLPDMLLHISNNPVFLDRETI